MRCFWCDSDLFALVDKKGEIYELAEADERGIVATDWSCKHCGHLVSEGNPRAVEEVEMVEVSKAELDQLKQRNRVLEDSKMAGPPIA